MDGGPYRFADGLQLAAPRRVLRAPAPAGPDPGAGDADEPIGSSPALRDVLRRARQVAPTDATVLISGETGTGKELLARALHRWSRRAARPFVAVNCAAIPHGLIASELFGHERGAFTGALQRRLGRFEQAAGGTLFLDEVGELPPETQVALLRVLAERSFERLGGASPIGADVRIVAATHRDLAQAAAAGAFRSDLYYRLDVFPLELPPLRERGADVRLLVERFVARAAQRAGKRFRGIRADTFERIEAHSWPGNVRELQNVVERSVILCESELFALDESWLRRHAPAAPPAAPPAPPLASRAATLDDVQREAILRALRARNWVVGGPAGAASLLGMKRTTLQARMHKLGIVPPRATAGLVCS
jgi:formate hydrogenlyase transcriptional activator